MFFLSMQHLGLEKLLDCNEMRRHPWTLNSGYLHPIPFLKKQWLTLGKLRRKLCERVIRPLWKGAEGFWQRSKTGTAGQIRYLHLLQTTFGEHIKNFSTLNMMYVAVVSKVLTSAAKLCVRRPCNNCPFPQNEIRKWTPRANNANEQTFRMFKLHNYGFIFRWCHYKSGHIFNNIFQNRNIAQ